MLVPENKSDVHYTLIFLVPPNITQQLDKPNDVHRKLSDLQASNSPPRSEVPVVQLDSPPRKTSHKKKNKSRDKHSDNYIENKLSRTWNEQLEDVNAELYKTGRKKYQYKLDETNLEKRFAE